jgi:hypothetical protein
MWVNWISNWMGHSGIDQIVSIIESCFNWLTPHIAVQRTHQAAWRSP